MMLALGLLLVVGGLAILLVLADYHGGPKELTQQIVADAKQLNAEWFPPELPEATERIRLRGLVEFQRKQL